MKAKLPLRLLVRSFAPLIGRSAQRVFGRG
jgi:hypothetical protein